MAKVAPLVASCDFGRSLDFSPPTTLAAIAADTALLARLGPLLAEGSGLLLLRTGATTSNGSAAHMLKIEVSA